MVKDVAPTGSTGNKRGAVRRARVRSAVRGAVRSVRRGASAVGSRVKKTGAQIAAAKRNLRAALARRRVNRTNRMRDRVTKLAARGATKTGLRKRWIQGRVNRLNKRINRRLNGNAPTSAVGTGRR